MAGGSTIVQLFNWRFDAVAHEAPRLGALGYSHVHVSPPQPSNEAVWQWWGRYQPVSHVGISGPLGSAEGFADMTRRAAECGLAIVVDVVAANPCGPPGMMFGHPLTNRDAAWQAGFDHLAFLARLGAGGFRFDGAQRLPPEFFAWILPRFPGCLFFGEIVEHDVRRLAPYVDVPGLRLYDFPLLATLRTAFAAEGDLRAWNFDAALPGASAISFVRNHDIERGQAGDHGIDETSYRRRYGVGWNEETGRLDRRVVDLAQTALLAQAGGIPNILSAMMSLPEQQRGDRHDARAIAIGLRFRTLCGARPQIPLIARRDLICWQRGDDRLVTISKADRPLFLRNLKTSLRPGRYRDLATRRPVEVGPGGRLIHVTIPPRSACLFVL
jgi:hypothetical protein